MTEEEKILKQERRDEKEQIAKELYGMVTTPGWRHLRKFLKDKADESFSLRGVNLTGEDDEIAHSVKTAKVKRDLFLGIDNWLKDKIRKGGLSYG